MTDCSTNNSAMLDFASQICLSVAQSRRLDILATEELAVPSILLMENAGRSLVEAFLAHFVDRLEQKRLLIVVGKGNNGGDGLVMARRFFQLGFQVEVVLLEGGPVRGDAAVSLEILRKIASLCRETNLVISTLLGDDSSWNMLRQKVSCAEVIIDAILGTGAVGPLKETVSRCTSILNESGKPIFAVDIPTGLDADSGIADPNTIHAEITCTLATLKTGLVLPQSKQWVGKLVVGDIGVPVALFVNASASLRQKYLHKSFE